MSMKDKALSWSSFKGYAELFLCARQTYFWNFSQENEYESYVIVQATE
jgi:hypothetical protein